MMSIGFRAFECQETLFDITNKLKLVIAQKNTK
jgi:protoheme ferro-lyase